MIFKEYGVDTRFYTASNNLQDSDYLTLDGDMDFIPIFTIHGLDKCFNTETVLGNKDIKEVLDKAKSKDLIKNNLNLFLESKELNLYFPKNHYKLHSSYLSYQAGYLHNLENLHCFSRIRFGGNSVLLNRYCAYNIRFDNFLFFMSIKKEDLALYKKCIIFGDEFPNDKLYLFYSTAAFKKAGNSYIFKTLKSILTNTFFKIPNINLVDVVDLNSWVIRKKAIPKMNSFKDKNEFNSFIKDSVLESLTLNDILFKEKVLETIPDKFKKVVDVNPSKIRTTLYSTINSRITIKSMRTINIKKSELATLVGLGETSAAIAVKLQVDEKDVKEAMITLGITKSRKAPKQYIINLEEDV